jgi:hypothetical protein
MDFTLEFPLPDLTLEIRIFGIVPEYGMPSNRRFSIEHFRYPISTS